MLKHHNYFKVHLPKKEYKGEGEEELAEILMEEFYLLSDGKFTENYTSINPKEDRFEISLYPSVLYAANKLNYTEAEKFRSINNFLDHSFVDHLTQFAPLYKATNFIEYHLHFYEGEEQDFFKHIKYEILSIIRKRIEKNNNESDYKSLEIVVKDWINEKMKNKNNYNTKINNAENVIINNGSKITNQSNILKKVPKDNLAKYALGITIIGLIISIIIGWNEIVNFFEYFTIEILDSNEK
ncbi:hypothetical protein [Flavobacterium limi]|uniref:Uncharacterized protein n=1 Tax=Flavobacterium limi TaxID=2045105 RepID=A0ABQ1U0X7_9FLAO|nr:hypothetical protein [Flavobacterium limi]GGF06421.1 hypothetical protein GCM10011518_14690 [Flavobacterium limi]